MGITAFSDTNARLFGLADQIGTVEEGKRADLIVVDGQPLDDVAVLQDASRVLVVMRDGTVQKRLPV